VVAAGGITIGPVVSVSLPMPIYKSTQPLPAAAAAVVAAAAAERLPPELQLKAGLAEKKRRLEVCFY